MSAPMMDIMRSVGRRATNDLRESTLAARDAAEGSFDKVLDNVRETRPSPSPARRSQTERRDAEYDSAKRESRRDDDTEANGLHVAQPTEQERVQARLGTSRLTKAAVLGQSTSQDTRATRRFLGNRLALGANTAGSAKGSRAHTRSASEGDLRNGAFGEQTTDAQDESVRKTRDGSTASNIRAGQDSKTEEAKTAARTEKSNKFR